MAEEFPHVAWKKKHLNRPDFQTPLLAPASDVMELSADHLKVRAHSCREGVSRCFFYGKNMHDGLDVGGFFAGKR